MKTVRLCAAIPFLFLGLGLVALAALIMGEDPFDNEKQSILKDMRIG